MAAKVFLGRDIETQNHVAIKFLKKNYPGFCSERISEFKKEIGVLKDLDHQGIVKMHDGGHDGSVVDTKHHVQYNIDYIVMDFEKYEMFDFCVDMGAMGEEAGKFFLHQLVDTMQYVHDNNISHRDLKLDNMLIDDNLNTKVLDFGLAYKGNSGKLRNWVGTPSYMAPEINEQKWYNGKEVDVFSLGVIIYSIVVGNFPFERATAYDKFYKLIMNGEIEKFFD